MRIFFIFTYLQNHHLKAYTKCVVQSNQAASKFDSKITGSKVY